MKVLLCLIGTCITTDGDVLREEAMGKEVKEGRVGLQGGGGGGGGGGDYDDEYYNGRGDLRRMSPW